MTGEQTRRRSRHRELWSRRWRTRTIVVALVTAAAVGLGGWSLALSQARHGQEVQRADAAEAEARVSSQNAVAIAEAVRQACEREGETAELLGDLCHRADEVVEEPSEPALVAPTEEQLRPLVQEYTEAWLARHPPQDGRTPTVAEIVDVVAGEVARQLAADPPQDGRTPTAAELRPIVEDVVAVYLEANPPPRGEPGEDGADGTPGRDGVDGAPGRDGADGQDGEDGQPPAGWTQPCGSLLDPDRRCVCIRDPASPDDAPTYSCEPAP